MTSISFVCSLQNFRSFTLRSLQIYSRVGPNKHNKLIILERYLDTQLNIIMPNQALCPNGQQEGTRYTPHTHTHTQKLRYDWLKYRVTEQAWTHILHKHIWGLTSTSFT